MIRALSATLAAALPSTLLMAQPERPIDVFSALEPGPQGVAYRIVAVKDSSRPAPFSADPVSPLDVTIHLWIPATAQRRCLTFGDYLARENGNVDPGSASAQLRNVRERFTGMVGSFRDGSALTEDTWTALVSTPMRGCDETSNRAAAGRHPVLIGRYLGGLWTIQAEYFASHGYVVAMVVSPGGINMGAVRLEDRPRVIARQIEQQARDLDVLVSVLARDSLADLGRVGVLAQAHAPILFAMQRPRLVKAIAIQDGALFSGGMSSQAVRRSASWNPPGLSGALLITESKRDSSPQPYAADFDSMAQVHRYRLGFETPLDGHDDISSAGYVARRALGLSGSRASHVAAFEANILVQHAFFDAWVRGTADRRLLLDTRLETVVSPAIATLEITAARPR